MVFCIKNADISKIKRSLVLKGIFYETRNVCVTPKRNTQVRVKLNVVSKDAVDKFEEKELTKEKDCKKNAWFDCCTWLINYISQTCKKNSR